MNGTVVGTGMQLRLKQRHELDCDIWEVSPAGMGAHRKAHLSKAVGSGEESARPLLTTLWSEIGALEDHPGVLGEFEEVGPSDLLL